MEKLGDLISRLEQKAFEQPKEQTEEPLLEKRSQLLPDRHPTRDFFTADILDWGYEIRQVLVCLLRPPQCKKKSDRVKTHENRKIAHTSITLKYLKDSIIGA